MFRIFFVLFAVFAGNLQAQSFSSLVHGFLRGRQANVELGSFAREHHFVLVAGFLNERTPFYWDDMVTALEQLGVPNEQISVIFPSSQNTIFKNSEFLKKSFEEIPTQKPLVVISHSKGAVETFQFAWDNPEFVKSRIKALFFLQGAFGGSYIADHLFSGEFKTDSAVPVGRRILMNAQFYVEWALLLGYKESLYELTTEAAVKWQETILSKRRSAHRLIDDRIFFLTSFETEKNYSFYLKNASIYLNTYHGTNDGLLLTRQQLVPKVGKTIATLQADHCDFVISYPISKQEKEFRFAFTNALVSWLRLQVRTGQLF